VTDGPEGIFREDALRRYASSWARDEPLRDVSPRLRATLWLIAALLGGTLLGVAVFVAMLIP
jgi:hypothetical protein